MALSLTSIAQLSSAFVDDRFPEVSVNGVLPGTGDPNRVELILTVTRDEPHRLMFDLREWILMPSSASSMQSSMMRW